MIINQHLISPPGVVTRVAPTDALPHSSPAPPLCAVSIVGDLELDRLENSVRRAGKLIKLKGVQFQMLDYLMQHESKIVSRTMLLENIWGADGAARPHFVEAHMSRLRAKVDRGYGQELIQTVRGIGYRIDDLAC